FRLSVPPSFHLSVCPSVRLSVRPSFRPSVLPSFRPSVLYISRVRIANPLLTALLAILPPSAPRRPRAAGPADSLLAPGISPALARHRAATIRAVRYGLTL